MCMSSKLLLFSFFFCKDGLMKQASYSCWNFLCVVLAVTHLKYRWYRLSCLPFVWHFFSLWHTHTRAHARMHTHLFYCNLERLRFLKKCTWLLWNFYSLIHLVHCPVLFFFSLQYYCWHHYTEFALFVHKQRLDQLCGVRRQVLPVHFQCGWRLNWSTD